MRISERLLTVLACCLLAAAIPAHASGKGERDLKQARELVDGKQYTQAMNLILDIMERYPDLREETDKLVARIMEVRRRVNEKVVELLAAEAARDVERGFAIIAELQALDPNPDPAVRRLIEAAAWALKWAGEFQRFSAVMDRAAEQLADGEDAEAIATYLEGFVISREVFDQAAYSPSHTEGARAAVARLETVSRQAAASEPDVRALADTLDLLLGRPLTDAGVEGFLADLETLAAARDRESEIRTLAAQVREFNAAIDAENGDIEQADPWLYVIEQIAFGRTDYAPEGLAFAARRPWLETARVLSDTATAGAEAAGTALEDGFADPVPLTELRTLAAEAKRQASLAQAVIEHEMPAYEPADGLGLGDDDRKRATDLAVNRERVVRLPATADAMVAFAEAETGALATVTGLERELAAIPSTEGSDLDLLRRGRTVLAGIRESAGRGLDEWNGRRAQASTGSIMASRATVVRDRFAAVASRALAADATAATRIAGLEAATFAPRYAESEARFEAGRALAAGTGAGQPAGKRPELGIEQYVRALADIGILLSDIDTWNARWSSEPADISSSEGIARLRAEQDALHARVAALQADLNAASTAARTAIDRATQLRGQGDSAFQAAQAEEKQQQYTEALASYTTARTSYEDSLQWQENAAARSRLADLATIIERISSKAREQSLAEVLSLIEKGVKEFTGTDFTAAIATLETAKTLWEAATGGENTTIEVYLDRAKAALLVTGKQEITRTDPIYEDIRGFMTQSELSYARAASLQRTPSRSDEYRDAIAAARSSVQAITAVVPEYREARLLALKIDRLELGETEFAKELRARVDVSLADARDARATEVTLRDAYYSLRDYREIEGVGTILSSAKRREIDAAIEALEVKLGLREPPPDPNAVRRSTTFYQQANAEYRKNVNDRIQWESALWLLQQSLAEGIRNTSSQKLLNEIVVKRGTLVDVLTSAELARYRSALTDYLNGNTSRAEAAVDELLVGKPKNPLLLDLKRQIQSTR